MNIPVPENTPAIRRAEKTNDRWVKAVVVIACVTLVGVVATLWLRFGDAAKQSTTQHAAAAILATNARNDCRTAYNSDRNSVVERANALERQANINFAGYLLGNPADSAAVLQQNKDALEAANQAVLALPTLDQMVESGYRLHGVTHPPCPVVR